MFNSDYLHGDVFRQNKEYCYDERESFSSIKQESGGVDLVCILRVVEPVVVRTVFEVWARENTDVAIAVKKNIYKVNPY